MLFICTQSLPLEKFWHIFPTNFLSFFAPLMDSSKVIKYNGPNYFLLLGLNNAGPIKIHDVLWKSWNGAVNIFPRIKFSILRVLIFHITANTQTGKFAYNWWLSSRDIINWGPSEREKGRALKHVLNTSIRPLPHQFREKYFSSNPYVAYAYIYSIPFSYYLGAWNRLTDFFCILLSESSLTWCSFPFLKQLLYNSSNSPRHRVEYLGLCTVEQIEYAANLNLALSFFVAHLYFYGPSYTKNIFGPERTNRWTPLSAATQAGLRWSIHQDHATFPGPPLPFANRELKQQRFWATDVNREWTFLHHWGVVRLKLLRK